MESHNPEVIVRSETIPSANYIQRSEFTELVNSVGELRDNFNELRGIMKLLNWELRAVGAVFLVWLVVVIGHIHVSFT